MCLPFPRKAVRVMHERVRIRRGTGCRWKDICVALQRREESIRTALRRRGIQVPYVYASRNRRLAAGLPPEKPAKEAKETKEKPVHVKRPGRPVS